MMLIVNSNNLSKSKYKDERRTGGWHGWRVGYQKGRVGFKRCVRVVGLSVIVRCRIEGRAMEHIVDIDPRNVGNVQNGASRHSCAREGRAGQTIKHSEGWVVCRYLGETYDKIHPM